LRAGLEWLRRIRSRICRCLVFHVSLTRRSSGQEPARPLFSEYAKTRRLIQRRVSVRSLKSQSDSIHQEPA
jgi:hypothetical protein